MFQKQLVALRMNCMKKTSLEKIKAMMNKIKFPNLFAVFLVVVSHFVFFLLIGGPRMSDPKAFAGASTVSTTYAVLWIMIAGTLTLKPKQSVAAVSVQISLVGTITYFAYGRCLGFKNDALLGIVGDVLLQPTLIPSLILIMLSTLIHFISRGNKL